MFPPPEDPGLRRGGEAGLLVDGGLGGATHQHDPAPPVHYVDRCLVLIHTSMTNKLVHVCVSSSPHPQCIVVPRPVKNLVYRFTTQCQDYQNVCQLFVRN